MRLQDFMSTDVETIAATETVERAAARMRASGIHHLVMVDGRRVVGVVSDHDLNGRAGSKAIGASPVADVGSRDVVTARPDTTTREAARMLRGRRIGCLPVLDKDRLVGIVTVSDLLDLVGRGIERPVETTRRYTLRRRGPRPAPSTRPTRR